MHSMTVTCCLLNVLVIWGVTPCCLVRVIDISEKRVGSVLWIIGPRQWNPNLKAVRSCKMSVTTYQSTRQSIPLVAL